jgi:hypothetical protein
MSSRRRSEKLTATKRRELQVAAAVAREAVVALHVQRALELVQHASGRVPALRMIDIYLRLLGLTGATAEVVVNRSLASLGRNSTMDMPSENSLLTDHEEDDQQDMGLLRTIKGRLRGRVHDTLRRTVELHTGATQAALLDLHVHHARLFINMVGEGQGIDAACKMYAELVHVPATLLPVLYIFVLDQMAAEEMPKPWTPAAPARGSQERLPDMVTRTRQQNRARRPA